MDEEAPIRKLATLSPSVIDHRLTFCVLVQPPRSRGRPQANHSHHVPELRTGQQTVHEKTSVNVDRLERLRQSGGNSRIAKRSRSPYEASRNLLSYANAMKQDLAVLLDSHGPDTTALAPKPTPTPKQARPLCMYELAENPSPVTLLDTSLLDPFMTAAVSLDRNKSFLLKFCKSLVHFVHSISLGLCYMASQRDWLHERYFVASLRYTEASRLRRPDVESWNYTVVILAYTEGFQQLFA